MSEDVVFPRGRVAEDAAHVGAKDDTLPTKLPTSTTVRQTPIGNPDLLASINKTLDSVKERSTTVVLQVPHKGQLRAAVYVNVGNGLSFMGWLDKPLEADTGLGYGVAVRKTW